MADDLFGEPDRGLVGLADIGRGKGDLAHLRRRGVGELCPAMPDIDVPQTRKPVDQFAPVGEVQYRALALDDDQWLAVVVRMVQRVKQKTPIRLDQLGRSVHVALLCPVAVLLAAPLPDNRPHAGFADTGWSRVSPPVASGQT